MATYSTHVPQDQATVREMATELFHRCMYLGSPALACLKTSDLVPLGQKRLAKLLTVGDEDLIIALSSNNDVRHARSAEHLRQRRRFGRVRRMFSQQPAYAS